jgi:hypothetical protein
MIRGEIVTRQWFRVDTIQPLARRFAIEDEWLR